MKYRKDMTFDQFLYANYGFSHTEEQRQKAFALFLNLNKKHQNATENSKTIN